MRYELNFDEDRIIDIESIGGDGVLDLRDCCKIMNEQQVTIQSLKSDKAIAEDYANIFEKENVKLRKQIDEQQSTIQELERKLKKYARIGEEQLKQIMELQDLCGESDSENAKLRNEIKLLKPTNIEQYEQIQKLQEENEQLQAQLREKKQDEQLYANEIVKLNKEAKEVLDFKSLGGDY